MAALHRHGNKSSKRRVKRLPPTADAARDEGPRLLPLGDRVKEPTRLEHYLDLADAALGRKKERYQEEPESEEQAG